MSMYMCLSLSLSLSLSIYIYIYIYTYIHYVYICTYCLAYERVQHEAQLVEEPHDSQPAQDLGELRNVHRVILCCTTS